jgi:hypothetical protein
MDKNAVEVVRRMGGYQNWETKMREVFPTDRAMDEAEVDQLLSESSTLASLAEYKRKWIKDSLAIAAYYAHDLPPPTDKATVEMGNERSERAGARPDEDPKPSTIVKLLVCDDAPQFQLLTEEVALCWIHDARHYKKLNPRVAAHKKQVEEFVDEYWDYYFELSEYRRKPSEEEGQRLSRSFNELFSRKTGYSVLDERIAITYAKKSGLLMVLKHPEIPLHNNPAELGARQRVRKRDVSLHARTERGVGCWDIFQTLVESCKKLGVNFYCYVRDRLVGEGHIDFLGRLIEEKARSLELGKSWENERPRPEWHKLEFRAWLR